MENPISYSDLFDPTLQSDIQGLIDKVKDVEKSLTDMIATVKSQAKGLGDALSATTSSTKGGRESTKEQAQDVEKLYAAYQQLGTAYEYIRQNLEKLIATKAQMNKADKLAEQAANAQEDSITRLKAQIELAKMALAGMTESERRTSDEGQRLLTVVKTLDGQIKSYEKSLKGVTTATKSATSSSKSTKAELLDLGSAYSSLSDLISKTGVSVSSLVKSQKNLEQASKNGKVANESLSGSYNQLYAQYNLIKIALNNMSKEMRDNVQVGKVWEQEALRIMDEMKAMQEATGKSTLSVGDYGKALNGLNISTQQVLREMPTLANSVSQFFIAISNNIPIFIDNFKRAQAELGGFTKAVGATLSAVFSWQTALLVLLTVLPKIAKAIHDKKKAAEEEAKAQKEANKENKEAVVILKSMQEIYTDIAKAGNDATTELTVLNKILTDTNRSWEDRVDAGKRLKQIFDEELKSFSAEEIAMGKAASNMKALTEYVLEQAKARATLNQVTELANQQLELQAQADILGNYRGSSASGKTVKEYYEAVKAANEAGKALGYLGAGVQEDVTKYGNLMSQIAGLQGQIDKLTGSIKPINLLEDEGGGGKSVKEKLMEIPLYYNEALRALIDGMSEGLQKEIALLDLEYKIAVEKRHEQEMAILDMMQNAKEDQKKVLQDELSNLRFTMSTEESNYYETRERLMREHIKAMTQAEVEMNDPEQEALREIKDRLQAEKRLRDWSASEEFDRQRDLLNAREHTAFEEVALKEQLNATLLDSEKKYWEDYLVMLKANGLELTDEFMEVINKLAGYSTTSSGQTSTRKKRGSRNFRNLTEVAFAFNNKTGEKNGPGFFNRKIKDEYMDFANAINDALQTSIDYMNEWMDKRIEMAEIAVEQAEKEANAAKTALDYEQQARANGYANNVELARKEYEEKLALQQQAIAEQKRLQKIQDSINTAQQISSLVTATANLWSAYSGIPVAGPALAIAATALMWGSFLAAKVQAAQVAGTVTHGEGMAEYLNYGGSHASGHDIDFGHTRDGKRRRVERGEVVGVIRKDSVEKYGATTVMNIIKSLNGGTFEKNYTNNGGSSSSALTQNGLSVSSVTQNGGITFGNSSIVGGSTFNGGDVITTSQLLSMVFGGDNSVANTVATRERLTRILNNTVVNHPYGSIGIRDIGRDIEANYAMAFNGASTDLSAIEAGIGTLVRQGGVRIVPTPYGRIEYRGNTKRIIKDA